VSVLPISATKTSAWVNLDDTVLTAA